VRDDVDRGRRTTGPAANPVAQMWWEEDQKKRGEGGRKVARNNDNLKGKNREESKKERHQQDRTKRSVVPTRGVIILRFLEPAEGIEARERHQP